MPSAPGERLLDGEALVLVVHAMTAGRAGRERLADLVVDAGLDACWLANLPTMAPAAAPTTVAGSSGGAAKPDEDADPAAPARALAAEVVAGVLRR